MSHIIRVDKRGRITLPSEVKKRMKMGSLLRLEEKGDRLELIPVTDPLERLKGLAKARASSEVLDELAENLIGKEALR